MRRRVGAPRVTGQVKPTVSPREPDRGDVRVTVVVESGQMRNDDGAEQLRHLVFVEKPHTTEKVGTGNPR